MTAAHFDVALWLTALPLLLVAATITWLVSLPLRNVVVVDSLWSLMLFAAGVVYALDSDPRAPRLSLTLWLTAIWAARLAAWVTVRNAGHGEPRHYRELRQRHEPHFAWKSLYRVFGLRALLAWLVSLPLLGAFASIAPLGALDYAGVLLWAVGFVVETGADWQLARFRANPANAGGVLRQGFWRFTRHPNYFGECCVWWGLYLVAASAGAWWAFAGPLLLTWLLFRVSGTANVGRRMPTTS